MRRTKALLSCLLALALVMLTACGARQQTVHRLSADRVTQAATVSQLQEVSDLIVVFTPETQENVLSRYSDGNVSTGYTRTTGQVTQVLKGQAPAQLVITEECYTADDALWTQGGYLPMETGKPYLLFLTAYDDGSDYAGMYYPTELERGKYPLGQALTTAEEAPVHGFEDGKVFEGCMPVEVLAKRGFESVRYGCMKPVGLTDPRTGKRPYAAVQLRKENRDGTMYNLVGFQTNLKFGEQKRVFSMIPGLENAEFVRYGVMHRNTFLDSPRLLDEWFMLRGSDNVFFGGQMTGVEGYVESAASGIIAGRALADRLSGKQPLTLPRTTMLGALCSYISDPTVENFQPMASSMGILPSLDRVIKGKQERYGALAQRALSDLDKALSDSEDT